MPTGNKKKKNVSTRSNNDATASSTAGKEAKAKRASQSKSSSNSKSDNNAQASSSGRKKSVLDGFDVSLSGFTIKLPAQKRTTADLSDAEDAPQSKRSKTVASPDNMGDPSVETSGDRSGRPTRNRNLTVDRLEREGDKISNNPSKPPMVPQSVATNPAAPAVRGKRLQNVPRIVRKDPPLQMEAPRLATKAQMSLPEAVENLMGNKSRPAGQAMPRMDLSTLPTAPRRTNQAPQPQPRPIAKQTAFAPLSGDTAARKAGRGNIDHQRSERDDDQDMESSAPSVEQPPFRPKARPTYKSNTSAPPSGDTAARKAGRDDPAQQGHERDEGQPQDRFQLPDHVQPRRIPPQDPPRRDDEDVEMGTPRPSVQPLPPPPQTRAKTASSAFVPPTGDIAHRMVERDSAENSVPNGDVDDDPGHYFDIQFKAACDIADKLAELGNAGGEEEQDPAPFGKGKGKEVIYEDESDDSEKDQDFQPEDEEEEEDEDEFEPDDEDAPPRKTEDFVDQNADEEDNLNFDDLVDQQMNDYEDDNFNLEDMDPAPEPPKKRSQPDPRQQQRRSGKYPRYFSVSLSDRVVRSHPRPPGGGRPAPPQTRRVFPMRSSTVSRDRQLAAGQTIDVLNDHRRRNKAHKPPNPADLDHHRRLQQGGSERGAAAENEADTNADDDEEEEEEEEEQEEEQEEQEEADDSRPRRKKRTANKKSGNPRKIGYYQKHYPEWGTIIKLSYTDLHRFLILENYFPDINDQDFKNELGFMLTSAITHFEEQNPLIVFDKAFLKEHFEHMVHVLWGEVTNFRGKCKTVTKSIVEASYKLTPTTTDYPEGQGLSQAEVARDADTLLEDLIHGSSFLRGVPPKRDNPDDDDDDTSDLNFMHDAIGCVVKTMLFTAHGGDQPVAKKYESRFRKYEKELMAAAATTMLCVFDQLQSPNVTVKLLAESYRSYYETLLSDYAPSSIPKLIRDVKHGPRMLRKWQEWRNGHFATAKWATKAKRRCTAALLDLAPYTRLQGPPTYHYEHYRAPVPNYVALQSKVVALQSTSQQKTSTTGTTGTTGTTRHYREQEIIIQGVISIPQDLPVPVKAPHCFVETSCTKNTMTTYTSISSMREHQPHIAYRTGTVSNLPSPPLSKTTGIGICGNVQVHSKLAKIQTQKDPDDEPEIKEDQYRRVREARTHIVPMRNAWSATPRSTGPTVAAMKAEACGSETGEVLAITESLEIEDSGWRSDRTGANG
ncbi:hypothetical protein DFH06DRAFT_1124360 [Mycena polygramma]|nr:hypothetical protein DFH06DRAFT_1124360 [Mycena polygramma]